MPGRERLGVAWVLMPNHVHLVLTPSDADSLRGALARCIGPGAPRDEIEDVAAPPSCRSKRLGLRLARTCFLPRGGRGGGGGGLRAQPEQAWDLHEEFEDSLRLVDEYGLSLIGLHMHIGSGVDYAHLHRVCDSMPDAVRRANRPLLAISACSRLRAQTEQSAGLTAKPQGGHLGAARLIISNHEDGRMVLTPDVLPLVS